MKHKLRAWIATLLALCLCLSFAGCADVSISGEGGSGTTPHTHTFAAEWSHDEEKHWHAATCGHDTQRGDEAAHTYVNGKCTECQYEHASHAFEYSNKTETEHTGTCSVCGKTVTEAHNYENGVCEDCEYEHQNHDYENGTCMTCEYEHASHAFEYSNKTETEHTGTCSVCGKTVTEQHRYANGVCEDCAYEHQNHDYADGKCKICEYEHASHAFEYSNKTETEHTGTCSVCGKTVTEQHRYANGVCEDCAYEHSGHAFGAYDKTADGHSQTCTVCGKIVTGQHNYENGKCKICDYEHQNHNYGAGNTCSVCGAKRPYSKSADGTKIYFGEYPQTEVKESGLKGMLGMEAGANPSSSNAGKWTDYGYYISGSVQSYMWYIDVEYQGGRYRGVYFTSYRPYSTKNSSSTGDSDQDDNGYYINTAYWFKYEPIEWRILEQKDGTVLLMANIILDSQQYYRSGTRTVNGKTVYPNNYKESDIRAWLNGTFYETAFDALAGQIIETTTVDNSASTTASDSNSYACENTQDKVFLLSYKEILNTSYGFSSSDSYDEARQLKSTDYAKSQGCWQSDSSSYRGNGWWWLRSPDYSYSHGADDVGGGGDAYYLNYGHVYFTYGGVVPALRIRL